MQVSVLHILNNFQVGISSLQKQNPSFLSQITSSLDGIQSASVAYNFCKWGAVILAIVATFGSVINRVNIFILRFRRNSPSLHSIPLLSNLHFDDVDDDDYTDTDTDSNVDDETCSSLSSKFEDDEDETAESSNLQRVDEYSGVRSSGYHADDQLQNGNGGIQRRRSISEFFSLSEIANSKSVVKLWDSIGFRLGLDFHDSSSSVGSVISVYDVNEEHRISPVFAGKPSTPAFTCESPAVMVSAGENQSGNLALKIWDTRLRRRLPAVIAEWGPSLGKTVGVESGDVQKLYVRNDGRYELTVGDMRNIKSPLANVKESPADMWWPNCPFVFKI